MFRLHKTKPAKSGERIDFKFSQFKVLQVPKGWDKLFVSIISMETGKTIAKSTKAPVRNGSCQWTDALSESTWVSQDESSKGLEECLFKLVVAMGSARSGFLGEAIVNMASCMSSSTPVPVSFPLKKCNHDTILQVKIQCLTPRIKLREDESKEINSHKEDLNADSHDVEMKSEDSDSAFANGTGSYSSKDLDITTNQEEDERREVRFSTSGSHHSYNSAENSIGRESFFPPGNLSSDERNKNGRENSTSSQDSAPHGGCHDDHSSFKSRITHSGDLSEDDPKEFPTSSLRTSGPSKSLLEAAEDTIEDLQGEARKWERNARKLMLDLDVLKNEYSEQFKNQSSLKMELSAACAERDGLQKEVEQLKLSLEKSWVKPTALEDSTFQDRAVTHSIKELECEIMFQKESNASLTLQLKRSQQSNIELVSVLQELEETVEKQKAEIEELSALQSKFQGMESSIQVNLEKNRNLMIQTQQLQESEKNLQAKVEGLEQALEQKNQNTETGSLNNQNILDMEMEYRCKISDKEREIARLKAELSQSLQEKKYSAEIISTGGGDGNLIREIEMLKSKLQEVESDCQELTEENLELLLKLKETKGNSIEGSVPLCNSRSEVSDQEFQVHMIEEQLKKKLLREIENDYNLSIQELEGLKSGLEIKVTELSNGLNEKRAEIKRFEASLLSKEEEIWNLQRYQGELEAKLSVLQKEKGQLEENMEIVIGESEITTKCLNHLQKNLTVLTSSVDSHVSSNKLLKRKISELESDKRELEFHVSEKKQENEELSAYISSLEDQLRSLTDERVSTGLELENSKSHAVSLQNEIAKLRNEMETQKTDTDKTLQEMQSQWSEAQEECECLRKANVKLQATAESLRQECNSFQKSYGELKRQNVELQGHCTHLEAKLRESHISFADWSNRVKVLEENISSLLEDSASKEKCLTSELNVLLKENEKQNEKMSLIDQMYFEKIVENKNLQEEVGELAKQLSATRDEREKIASDSVNELSSLRLDIAKLELELNTTQIELKAKVQGLMDELAASKQNEEMLKVDAERMSKLLANYESCEEKFKTTVNGLELKLTVSDYEQQQLMEESTTLKVQLLKVEHLQDEVLALKNELNATKSEKKKQEASLHLISGECKELKVENKLYIEKITDLQKAVSELEVCKQNTVALEEKLLQMKGDLVAKEAICEQDAELRNEFSRVKRVNKQLQQQIQQLQEERENCITRVQSLEEELILMKEEQQNQRKSSSVDSYSNQHQKQGNNGYRTDHESHLFGVDAASKIRLLEDELTKATEANNAYKVQVKRLMSEGRKGRTGSPRKATAEGDVVPKEKFERTKSSLETELRDIRERYFHMSLKYAEVEAQREELVMKLKAANNAKRRF